MRRTVTSHRPSRVAMRASCLLLLGLAACSPYSYSKEVSAISAGVDNLSTAFSDGYTQLAADRETVNDLQLTTARAPVAISQSCTDARLDAPCLAFKQGTDEPPAADIERLRGKTLAALAVLRDYAHALSAVSNAADRTEYDAAVAQFSGSVGELAKFADAVAPGASVAAPAVVSFAGWVFGTALDQQRFDSLKAGVTAAGTASAGGDAPIAVVATTLGDGLEALRRQRAAEVQAEIGILRPRLQPSLSDADYRQGLSDLKAAIAVRYGLTQSNPAAAAKSLVKAHEELLAALNDPKRSYPALLKAVGDFTSQAEALKTAFATASAAAKMPKKGS